MKAHKKFTAAVMKAHKQERMVVLSLSPSLGVNVVGTYNQFACDFLSSCPQLSTLSLSL